MYLLLNMNHKKKPKVSKKTKDAVSLGGIAFITVLFVLLVYQCQGFNKYWNETRAERGVCVECLEYLLELGMEFISLFILICGVIVSIYGVYKWIENN